MLKHKKQVIGTFMALSLSLSSVTALAEETQAITSGISAEYTDSETSVFLPLKDIFTIPETWGDAASQIYDMLGLPARKYQSSGRSKKEESKEESKKISENSTAGSSEDTEAADSTSSSRKKNRTDASNSILDQLISLGYLDDSYSTHKEEDLISEEEYLSLLQEIYGSLIETQEDADSLEENPNDADETENNNAIIIGDTISFRTEADHILSAKMDALTLNSAAVSILTLKDGGTLTLEETTSDVVYLDLMNEDETTITGDAKSSIQTLVVNQAGDLVINGDLSLDTLIITGSISSLTLDIDCNVINKSGEELLYTNAEGESVSVDASDDSEIDDEPAEDDSQDSSDKTSRKKSGSRSSGKSKKSSSKTGRSSSRSDGASSGDSSSSSGSGSHSSKKRSSSKAHSSKEQNSSEETADNSKKTSDTSDTADSSAKSTKESKSSNTSSLNEEETEAEIETEIETETETEAEAETEMQTETQTKSQSETEMESEAESPETEQASYEAETEETQTDVPEKTAVTVPDIKPTEYTGELLTADISGNEYYTVTVNEGGTAPGIYTVILTLNDPENCRWENDTEGIYTEIELEFEILEAVKENDTADNTAEDETNSISAESDVNTEDTSTDSNE